MKRYEENGPELIDVRQRPLRGCAARERDAEQATWAEVGAGVFTWGIVFVVGLIGMGLGARVVAGFFSFGWHIFDRVIGL